MNQELQDPSKNSLLGSNPKWYPRPNNENKNSKKGKTVPCKRWGHSTTISDSRLFIYGGTGYTTNSRCWESIHQLDLETWDWTKLESNNKAPISRDSHSCIVLNNKLYIFGGSSGNDSKNDMYEYDLATNMWKKLEVKGNVPTPREGHAACLLDDRYMIISGGWNGEETFDNCYLFDIPRKEWISVHKMLGLKPSPRESQSCCMVRRDMYFFGGQGNSIIKDGESYDNFYNDLHRLRIRFDDENQLNATATWELIEPQGAKPSRRSSHSSCACKDRYVFIVGGEGYPSNINEDKQPIEYKRVKEENSDDYPCFPKNDVWAYDVEINKWLKLKVQNEAAFIPRFAHSSVIYKELLVIFGGLYDYHHSTNDIFVLSLNGGNPFQPKSITNISNYKVFADENYKDDPSQSEKSSVFHDEADYKSDYKTDKEKDLLRSNELLDLPKQQSTIEQKNEVVLTKSTIEDAPLLGKPLISMNFLSSLSSALTWPLAAFGLLLDNSQISGAKSFYINYLTKQKKVLVKDLAKGENSINSVTAAYLLLEDDGLGWSPEDFIKILSNYDTDDPEEVENGKPAEVEAEQEEEKIFNSEEEEVKSQEQKKEQEKRNKRMNEYSFNFKVASMRLGKNIIIISRNGDEISVGFLTSDRRFNPNLHKNYVFYYSWKKSNGECLTKRAEKNKFIIQNALKGMFSIEELCEGIETIGNRIVIMDLTTVLGTTANHHSKQDLELLSIKKEGPDRVNDIMVRSLDKNLKVFYHNPSSSLVDISLRTYLTHFFLNPDQINIDIYLNGEKLKPVNTKEMLGTKAIQSNYTKVGGPGTFEGLILKAQNDVPDQQMEETNQVNDSKVLDRGFLNQGVLIYYKNRLIRRLENPKMGNLDFLSSHYLFFLEGRKQDPKRMFFERDGYIELRSEFKPNAFKTEIENPFCSNFLHGMVMSQIMQSRSLNGKRPMGNRELREEQLLKKIKAAPL